MTKNKNRINCKFGAISELKFIGIIPDPINLNDKTDLIRNDFCGNISSYNGPNKE